MPKLKKDTLIQLYTTMIRSRAFDEKAMELFIQNAIPGFTHVGIGQEAVAAGVCANLRANDAITVTHRGHAQIVAKGADIKGAMAELFGKASGVCKGKAGSMHIADKTVGVLGANAIVGAGIPIATGAAFSYQLQGTDQVAACFFGDGACEEGVFHESLNMAALWSLPIIYCCENNSWAQFTPHAASTKILDIAPKAATYGMPGHIVDGDDVLAVYEAAGKAVEHARKGEGPTFLELKTHRWFGHYVGDPQKYRPPEDIQETRKFDPIAKFETYLIQNDIQTSDELKTIRDNVKAVIEEAVKFAQEVPLPPPEDALTGVYSEGGE